MRTTWLALGTLLALTACGSGDTGTHGTDAARDVAVDATRLDVTAGDSARLDVGANDTATMDTAAPTDTPTSTDTMMSTDTPTPTDTVMSTDVPTALDVAPRDTGATDDVTARDATARMCPATCTTDRGCSTRCPVAPTGAWCCVRGACEDLAMCPVATDAGPTCTGTGECDTTHPCGGREVCCSPLPGLSGCGHCSPGICPGG